MLILNKYKLKMLIIKIIFEKNAFYGNKKHLNFLSNLYC